MATPRRGWLADRTTLRERLGVWLRWLLITALAFGVTMVGLVVILRPSAGDLIQLALALAIAGLISAGLGEAALRWADSVRLGGVRLKLIIPSLLTALVIAFNSIVVTQLMFISNTDSQMLLAILFFGVAISLAIAFSIAQEMTAAIRRIESSARRISAGEYDARIPTGARDSAGAEELASLAESFNHMAASVQEAFAMRQQAETERRQLVASLSHDLRTPITTVRAMIEAIDDGVVTDPATVHRYQRAMRGELSYLTVLMDDLFELSRLESGAMDLHLERMPLDEVISNVLEATREQADRAGVRLSGQVDGTLPPVLIDARQTQRALTNLVQNALRHTPIGGQVVIRAATHTDVNGARWVATQVIDSGEGIAAEDLPHIFERTYRAETSRRRETSPQENATHAPRSGGAGLGLAITRGVVEAHGGSIMASSPLPAEARALLAQADSEEGDDEGDGADVGATVVAGGRTTRAAAPGALFTFTLPAAVGASHQ